MQELIDRLCLAYGGHDGAAWAIGYSDRQYRNIRRKAAKGEVLALRIIQLMRMKLQQIKGDCPNGDDDD